MFNGQIKQIERIRNRITCHLDWCKFCKERIWELENSEHPGINPDKIETLRNLYFELYEFKINHAAQELGFMSFDKLKQSKLKGFKIWTDFMESYLES